MTRDTPAIIVIRDFYLPANEFAAPEKKLYFNQIVEELVRPDEGISLADPLKLKIFNLKDRSRSVIWSLRYGLLDLRR
ncbi:MAG: hypothetical protein JRI61_11380 [Deltaproteobacteria bacterium]|nr:hypothetical protein [Deltaproteobacteria bacterium]